MADDCTTCRYSQVDHDPRPEAGFEDGPLLRCHRYPPVVVAVDGQVVETLPNVGPEHWCGEHTGHVGPGGP